MNDIIKKDQGINESQRFERGADPKKSLDIGILNRVHKITDKEELINFIFKHLPIILRRHEIPDDILSPLHKSETFPEPYYLTIQHFINNNIDMSPRFLWGQDLKSKLLDAGYKYGGSRH